MKKLVDSGRVEYYTKLSELIIDEIPCILFVSLAYSGVSKECWNILSKAMNDISEQVLRFIVIESDKKNVNFLYSLTGEIPHGKGETYFIRKSRVVWRIKEYQNISVSELEMQIRQAI